MAKPTSKSRSDTTAEPGVQAPAHQIWLAGLGAMAQAQAQGSKAFETLVSDGLAFQRKSQQEAQQRLQEATERFTHMAQGLGQEASGRLDRLEHVFEERVAKALHRLGMPSLQDFLQLQARVEALEALQAEPKAAPMKAAAKAAVKKPAVKASPRRRA